MKEEEEPNWKNYRWKSRYHNKYQWNPENRQEILQEVHTFLDAYVLLKLTLLYINHLIRSVMIDKVKAVIKRLPKS
jgi:hypothetical protein